MADFLGETAMTHEGKRPLCFMVRNKPQSADIIDLVLKTKRAFLGYPARQHGFSDPLKNFQTALCDLSCSEEEWQAFINTPPLPHPRRILSGNRNLVKEATEIPGSIILVPRPDRGKVYCGVIQRFELVDNPDWGERYLSLRRQQNLDISNESSHLMDVVQSFLVDEWQPIPMTSFPAWVRKSFFGRSTIARIHPINIGQTTLQPYDAVQELMKSSARETRAETPDINEIKTRLLTDISPEVLEHMMVGILQCINDDESWLHVGGSGDGGVDGLAVNMEGEISAILQCKWKHDGGDIEIGAIEFEGKRILASLLHPPNINFPNTQVFYGIDEIADLVLKHADRLPWAKSMKIKAN
ncbi:MAG: hypothetical protein COA60_003755 [Robiginitomaculum sp.]|nr:hypothetical protein [Robiginitomaculum sp.]